MLQTEMNWIDEILIFGDGTPMNNSSTGVVVKWGPPDFGAPHPHITRDLGLGGPIQLGL